MKNHLFSNLEEGDGVEKELEKEGNWYRQIHA